jgi:hypothetical protein
MSGGRSLAATDRAIARAWELFAGGSDDAGGVRPQIVESWLRCRDQHGIDPARNRAEPADVDPVLAPVESVTAAELGAAAMRLLPDVSALGGVVVVADGRGRMLSAWGDPSSASRGGDQNLSPLYSWAEPSVGTTGVATSLLARGPVSVRRFEHWCEAFQDWSCTAVAVRDVLQRPLGVIGVSIWQRELPETVAQTLGMVARDVEGRLLLRLRGRPGDPALVAGRGQAITAPSPTRLVGMRADRSVIVPVASVRLITVEDGIVWLTTDDGRLRADARGLDELERRLESAGFVRVSRSALVNVEHIRELVPAFKGAVWLAVSGVSSPVAVSRRRVATLRAALGI